MNEKERNERTPNRTDAKPCLSDMYKMSTQAKRRKADVRLSGRSMVEMLGVLAIIGVLSVGAMSGYSKAMFKYKLNKYAESTNMFINNFIQIKDSLNQENETITYYPKILDKLGLIPDGMHYVCEQYIQDVFGNNIQAQYDKRVSAYNFDHAILIFDKVTDRPEICKTILEIAKANSFAIWQAYLLQYSGGNSTKGILYGDKFCTSSVKCLRNLSLNDIETLCYTYKNSDENYYKLQINFKN